MPSGRIPLRLSSVEQRSWVVVGFPLVLLDWIWPEKMDESETRWPCSEGPRWARRTWQTIILVRPGAQEIKLDSLIQPHWVSFRLRTAGSDISGWLLVSHIELPLESIIISHVCLWPSEASCTGSKTEGPLPLISHQPSAFFPSLEMVSRADLLPSASSICSTLPFPYPPKVGALLPF
jgi:hypothetical protein